ELTEKELTEKELTEKELTEKESAEKELTGNYGRIVLLKTAINETKEHPLTGLGPFGYVQKYEGSYTHNVIADFFAEYGIIVACLFAAFVVFAYIKMGKSIKVAFSIAELCVLLFLTGTCFELGFRDYFPVFQPFWFFIGYTVWFIIPRKQCKKELSTDEVM
ncbi:MAG: hypothetical protein RR716_01910, partial [Christensenellaceae bacterium]